MNTWSTFLAAIYFAAGILLLFAGLSAQTAAAGALLGILAGVLLVSAPMKLLEK